MSKLKEKIDNILSQQTEDYKESYLRLDSAITEMCFATVEELENLLKETDEDWDKYYGLNYSIKLMAFRILLSSNPQDQELKKKALYYIDFQGDPGDLEDFEKAISVSQ